MTDYQDPSKSFLTDISEDNINEQARTSNDPQTLIQIAHLFSDELGTRITESGINPTRLLKSLIDRDDTDKQEIQATIGLAFQGYALIYPTKEDLERRVNQEYPNLLRNLTNLEQIERVKKHAEKANAILRQKTDPFRDFVKYGLGITQEDLERVIELRRSVGEIVPEEFSKATGEIWNAIIANTRLAEIGKQLVEIVKKEGGDREEGFGF